MAATERLAITREGVGGVPATAQGKMAATKSVKRGWLCARNATGFIVPFTAATTLTSAGIAYADADNATGADGDITIDLYEGVCDLAIGTTTDALTDADIGAVVYGIDNQTVGKTNGSSTRSAAGIFYGINPDTGLGRVLVGRLAAAIAKVA